MSLEENFKSACEHVKKFAVRPPDTEILEVYGLYKQATLGDISISNDSEDPVVKAKYEAWSKMKGLELTSAKEKYISKINELAMTYDKQ